MDGTIFSCTSKNHVQHKEQENGFLVCKETDAASVGEINKNFVLAKDFNYHRESFMRIGPVAKWILIFSR